MTIIGQIRQRWPSIGAPHCRFCEWSDDQCAHGSVQLVGLGHRSQLTYRIRLHRSSGLTARSLSTLSPLTVDLSLLSLRLLCFQLNAANNGQLGSCCCTSKTTVYFGNNAIHELPKAMFQLTCKIWNCIHLYIEYRLCILTITKNGPIQGYRWQNHFLKYCLSYEKKNLTNCDS